MIQQYLIPIDTSMRPLPEGQRPSHDYRVVYAQRDVAEVEKERDDYRRLLAWIRYNGFLGAHFHQWNDDMCQTLDRWAEQALHPTPEEEEEEE